MPGGPMLATPSGRNLMIPGGKMPYSRLYVEPPSGKRLAPPQPIRMAKPKPAPEPAPAAEPEPAPKAVVKTPEKAPEKPVTAKAPAKPEIKEPTKLSAPKKSATAPAAPKKPVELAKKSPPPMPPKQAPAPAKTETKSEPPKVSIPIPATIVEDKKPTEQAAVPVAGQALKVGHMLRVSFAGQGTKLPAAAKPELANLAKRLQGEGKMRLQLLAYAGGDNLTSSLARRLSLSRALAVRSYLIERGVRSTRIDVRALGNKTSEQPFNRVDLNIAER